MKVVIKGFDEHGNPISEVVEAQGTTPVKSQHTYRYAELPIYEIPSGYKAHVGKITVWGKKREGGRDGD